MKVAYVFALRRLASYKLGQMILPQLEAGTHGVEVVAMFFFDDNTFVLRQGDALGERLAKLAAEQHIVLLMCDTCALERGLAAGEPVWCDPGTGQGRTKPAECHVKDTVQGVRVGCFPDLYAALSANPPDQVITFPVSATVASRIGWMWMLFIGSLAGLETTKSIDTDQRTH
jgi:sulfur relay (sulfurtransferase) complex TusBCD TusD component (DsrE family)